MEKLMSRVRDDAKKKGYTLKILGNHLGYTKGNMSAILNGKRNINFLTFLKLLKFIYEDNFDIIMSTLISFAYKTKNIQNVRIACEWFYNNGKFEVLKEIFVTHKDDPFVQVYMAMFENRYKGLSRYGLLTRIEDLKESLNDCEEAKILNRIMSLYAYIDYMSYMIIPDLADSILEKIDKIKNSYFKESFKYRVIESLVLSYLKQDKIEIVEQLTEGIVNDKYIAENFPMFYTQILLLLSQAYVFTDYDRSLKYINSALYIYNDKNLKSPYREKSLKSTHDFIKIFHGKLDNLFLVDKSEEIHLHATLNSKREHKRILKELEQIKRNNGFLSPFQLYYKALITNSTEDINRSLVEFEKQGDVHYAKLPKRLIKKKYNM